MVSEYDKLKSASFGNSKPKFPPLTQFVPSDIMEAEKEVFTPHDYCLAHKRIDYSGRVDEGSKPRILGSQSARLVFKTTIPHCLPSLGLHAGSRCRVSCTIAQYPGCMVLALSVQLKVREFKHFPQRSISHELARLPNSGSRSRWVTRKRRGSATLTGPAYSGHRHILDLLHCRLCVVHPGGDGL